jgi:hypothetical protein
MYDTLMQMGRWFGYRPGYLDLCRLFTTTQLIDWYRHIALAETELRREFDYMVAAGLSPEKYGLRVRTHPDGMIVTAINKMCHSQELELSWAGVLVQTTQLPKDRARITANLRATEQLLQTLGTPDQDPTRGTRLWSGVGADAVANYVESLQLPAESARAGGRQLAAFIRQQTGKDDPELTKWSVAMVSNSQAPRDRDRTVAGFSVGLIERTPESQKSDSFALRKANIINPPDQAIDLRAMRLTDAILNEVKAKPGVAEQLEEIDLSQCATLEDVALQVTRSRVRAGKIKGSEETKVPNGRVVREIRPKSHALLLIYPLQPPEEVPGVAGAEPQRTGLDPAGDPVIGVALSFPTSDTVLGVSYRVNKVWGAEMREDAEYDD